MGASWQECVIGGAIGGGLTWFVLEGLRALWLRRSNRD